jgi:uncharacterized protein (TIGR02996 family)
MTHAEEAAALLRAVLDHPGDDAVRLVYADWLDEQGDPYAGVIREGLRPPRRKESYLGVVLFGYREQFSIPEGMTVTFNRGFIEEVKCPLGAWLEHGPAIIRKHPVTALALTDREPLHSVADGWWHWLPESANWLPAGGADGSLPDAVFDWLITAPGSREPDYAAFDTQEDAYAALIAWAKGQTHEAHS